MEYATIQWDERGKPRSLDFSDIYAPHQGAAEQCEYVYLQGNNLPQRWQRGEQPRIGELGFGTGLNFLVTWQSWLRHAPTHDALHYISCENAPLHPDDLRRFEKLYPELEPFYNELLDALPLPIPGVHHLTLDNDRVHLYLLYGDALESLRDYGHSENTPATHIDAWYLDGFTPQRNPAMWSAPLMHELARHSATHATYATYSSSRSMRENLGAAGFTTESRPGFGPKLEMTIGNITRQRTDTPSPATAVTIIGGGLAGCSAAYACAMRGLYVELYECRDTLATQASAQPTGIIFPQLSKYWDARTALSVHGTLATLRTLGTLLHSGADIEHDMCGMLWLPLRDTYRERLQGQCARLALPEAFVHEVNATQASELAGIPVMHGGLFFPHVGWMNMPQLCQALASHPRITVHCNAPQESVVGTQTQPVIIANGHHACALAPSKHLPLLPLHGQLSICAARPSTQPLKTVLCYDGHCTPAIAGQHYIGATFDRDAPTLMETTQAHERNLNNLNRCIGDNAHGLHPRAAILGTRTSTPDRMPLVGHIAEHTYISLGHGSRGLTTCLLSARHIAALITGRPAPLSTTVARAIAPQRYLKDEVNTDPPLMSAAWDEPA